MSDSVPQADDFCGCGCGWRKAEMPLSPSSAPTKTVVRETLMPPMRLISSDPYEEGWVQVEYSDGSRAYRFTQQNTMPLPYNVYQRLLGAGVPEKVAHDFIEKIPFYDVVWTASLERIPKLVNLLMNDVLRVAPEYGTDEAWLSKTKMPVDLSEALNAVIDANLDGGKTKLVVETALSDKVSVGEAIKKLGFDKAPLAASEIAAAVRVVIAANPGEVAKYRSGKKNLVGFFVGKVMRQLGPIASAPVVKKEVEAQLGEKQHEQS